MCSCEYRLQTSESDVYRRQILTFKVDPRAVMVNPVLAEGRSVNVSRTADVCQVWFDARLMRRGGGGWVVVA